MSAKLTADGANPKVVMCVNPAALSAEGSPVAPSSVANTVVLTDGLARR